MQTSVLTEIDEKRPIDLIVSTEDNRPLTDAEITAISKTENVTQVAVTKALRVPAGDEADPMGNGYMQINEAADLSKVAHKVPLRWTDGCTTRMKEQNSSARATNR